VILAAGLVGGAGAWWWHTRNHSQLSFRTATVKRGNVTASISASGTIEPEEVVDVGAQVAGLIKSFGKDILGKTIDYVSVIEEGAGPTEVGIPFRVSSRASAVKAIEASGAVLELEFRGCLHGSSARIR